MEGSQVPEQHINQPSEGNAIVYCEAAFDTTNGKTAHGLVRHTRRYQVLSVIDSTRAGHDAGTLLDGRPAGIPVVADLDEAIAEAKGRRLEPTHFVVGLATDGGRLSDADRVQVTRAMEAGLNVDSGLHDFLSDDGQLASVASRCGVRIRDVRKPPSRDRLHFFTGKIDQVESLRVALLGTDSAVGKRTTAWILIDALRAAGHSAELVGTGQTAWMQGARYGLMLDSLINDFVTGEIEHAVWSAWDERRPEVIVVEGQGSLVHPAYPGGLEILAASRPHCIVLQHAPARTEYDGIPGFPIDPLDKQIEAVELLSGRPVVAITINHEGLARADVPTVCAEIEASTGRPTRDVLLEGIDPVMAAVLAAR